MTLRSEAERTLSRDGTVEKPTVTQTVDQNRFGLDTTATTARQGGSFQEAQRRSILDALEKYHWNRTKAAELLQVPRHILVYRMKQLGIQEP